MSRATVSDISCGLNGSQGSRKGGGENYVAQKHLRLWRREGATLMIIWRYSRKKGAFMKTSACIPALATVLLITAGPAQAQEASGPPVDPDAAPLTVALGRAHGRERVSPYVKMSVVAVSQKKKTTRQQP